MENEEVKNTKVKLDFWKLAYSTVTLLQLAVSIAVHEVSIDLVHTIEQTKGIATIVDLSLPLMVDGLILAVLALLRCTNIPKYSSCYSVWDIPLAVLLFVVLTVWRNAGFALEYLNEYLLISILVSWLLLVLGTGAEAEGTKETKEDSKIV